MFSVATAGMVVVTTFWAFGWYVVFFAAGMMFQAWVAYGDIRDGVDDAANGGLDRHPGGTRGESRCQP
jgi:hypothetical protein